MENLSRTSEGLSSAVLAIIAGALMLISGVFIVSTFSLWNSQIGTTSMMYGWGGPMMGFRGGGWGMMIPVNTGFMWWGVAAMSAIPIGAGAVSLAGGLAIQKKPESADVWGIGILIASIVGLIGTSGFFVGPILGVIGGILAITKK